MGELVLFQFLARRERHRAKFSHGAVGGPAGELGAIEGVARNDFCKHGRELALLQRDQAFAAERLFVG